MSVGNLKDQGNKGNNFPYQLKTLQLLGAINDGISALPGVDHESRTSTYQATCTICGPGYSNGDIIIRYDIIDLATGLIDTTIWFNDTLQTQLSPAPLPGDLTPVSAPTSVTVLNGPGINAVNIQDGGNSITIDGTLTGITNTVNVNQVERTGTSGYTGAITGVAATDVIAAPGAGLFTYVTQILVTNSHATVGTLVTIQTEDGTGLYAGYAAPAGGGFSVTFTVPIKMPVANKKLQAICGTTGANVYVSASGYIAA
jgi:hypothetical protein